MSETLDFQLLMAGLYAFISGMLGYFVGWLLNWTGYFALHKWAYDIKADKNSLVTAYVMTKTVLDNKILMYRGQLNEYYQKSDGTLSYVVMSECTKFVMHSTESEMHMSEQLTLFSAEHADNVLAKKTYLIIDGENIANVLIERSPPITETEKGRAALDRALSDAAGQEDLP